MSLVTALAGVRVLAEFYDITTLPELQKLVFQATDVVLTAGILAGGSKGINGMTTVIGNFFESTAKRAKDGGQQ